MVRHHPIARGSVRLPAQLPGTYVYWLRDDHQVIYVGMAGALWARLGQHAATQPWWPQVREVAWQLYGSQADAARAERDDIRRLTPSHNTVHNPQPPEQPRSELAAAHAEVAPLDRVLR